MKLLREKIKDSAIDIRSPLPEPGHLQSYLGVDFWFPTTWTYSLDGDGDAISFYEKSKYRFLIPRSKLKEFLEKVRYEHSLRTPLYLTDYLLAYGRGVADQLCGVVISDDTEWEDNY